MTAPTALPNLGAPVVEDDGLELVEEELARDAADPRGRIERVAP